nr:hypothetical protein [Sphingomonas sp. Leaf25]
MLLGHAVTARRREELDTLDHLLAHISPLGWAHILLTGNAANRSASPWRAVR